ncbi:MAG: DUF4838 domain-containing protein [Christensenellales bacterium]
MRAYVSAKLFWNPDRDVNALTTDFIDNYYKAAAPTFRNTRQNQSAYVRNESNVRGGKQEFRRVRSVRAEQASAHRAHVRSAFSNSISNCSKRHTTR